MPLNSSSTGGILAPAVPSPPLEDGDLDAVFQSLVAAITGLDGTLVLPRWQEENPKQPDVTVNWCAIGVITRTPDDSPYIVHSSNPEQDNFVDHEDIEVLASFYGPNSGAYASMLRDGLRIPQNTELLGAQQIRWADSGPIRAAPELFNQQWIRRQDMTLTFRRRIARTYPVTSLLIGDVHLTDDTTVNDTIVVPPGSPIQP